MNNHKIEYTFNAAMFMDAIRNKCDKNSSLRKVAAKAGISAASLSRIQNGETPDMNSFLEVCSRLDLSPSDFFIRRVWVLS